MESTSDQYLYKKERKDKFLEKYKKRTREEATYTFIYSSRLEKKYSKDLCEFEYQQLIELLKTFKTNSLNEIWKRKSHIKSYIDWCVNQGHEVDVMAIENITSEDLENCLFDDFDESHISSRQELYELVSKCRNIQDAIVFVLIYEGVLGEKLSELINLQEKDCDFDKKTITINRYNKSMKLHMPNTSMELIKSALKQKIFYTKKGKKRKMSDIYETDYVLRRYKNKEGKNEPVSEGQIRHNRMIPINDILGLHLNPHNILFSGLVDYLKCYHIKKGYLDNEDYQKAHIRFGLSTNGIYYTKKKYERMRAKYGSDWFVSTHGISDKELSFFKWDVNKFKDSVTLKVTDEEIDNMVQDEIIDQLKLEDKSYEEGKRYLAKHMCIERKAVVIKLAKSMFKAKNKRLFCEICTFDFNERYGEEYIEGHHQTPLSQLKSKNSFEVSYEDIILVCSNCHRMIHKKKLFLSKDKIKEKLFVHKLNG